jgi:hypothetical protein
MSFFRRVLLTRLGGGALGNDGDLIIAAMGALLNCRADLNRRKACELPPSVESDCDGSAWRLGVVVPEVIRQCILY